MVKHALLAVVLAVWMVPVVRAERHSLPAGTTFHCRLTQTLSTKMNFQGDLFSATVAEPLIVDGRDIVPVGSVVDGRVVYLDRPGRLRGVGEMRLSAEKITFPDGRSYPVSAVLLSAFGAEGVKVTGEEGTVKGPNSRLRTLQEISVGMGSGGFLGTVIGGFHGAVLGGAVGGVAGFLDTVRKRGKDLTLPAGTELSYQLMRPLEVAR